MKVFKPFNLYTKTPAWRRVDLQNVFALVVNRNHVVAVYGRRLGQVFHSAIFSQQFDLDDLVVDFRIGLDETSAADNILAVYA